MAVVTDVQCTMISNRLIGCGLITGLLFQILGNGYAGILSFILNTIIPVILLILLFQLRALGAGDIKLFSVTGSFLTTEQLIKVMLLSFLIAAVIGIGKIVYLYCVHGGKREKYTKIHFSVAILLAYILAEGGM